MKSSANSVLLVGMKIKRDKERDKIIFEDKLLNNRINEKV